MTTSRQPVNRAARRATRRERAPQESHDTYASDDLATLSDVVGAPVTQRDVETAVEMLDTVNLDELVAPTVRVAVMERTPHDITLDDGTVVTRYTLKSRVAEITLWANVETQLKALALNRARQTSTIEQQVPAMLALLLEMWQLSEPDMTLERLRAGLDIYHISKLFNLAFTRPSRQ